MGYLAVLLLAVGMTWGTVAHSQWAAQELEDIDLLGLTAAAERRLEEGAYRDAAELADQAIEQIEREGGRYHARLVEPLTVRGQALHGMGRYEEALEAYDRAQQISRIDAGLHSAEHVDIVYEEAETWVALDEIERANEHFRYAIEVLERAHGPDSPELVPGLFRLAQWNLRTHMVFSAREHYKRAAEILRESYGETDPRVIPALTGLAHTYKRERLPPFDLLDDRDGGLQVHAGRRVSQVRGVAERRPQVNRYGEGEEALRDIVEIRESDPNSSPQELAEAYLELADWNLIFERYDDATTLYRYARQIWLEQGGDLAMVNRRMDEPRAIYRPLPKQTRDSEGLPDQLKRSGEVTLRYSVDEQGRTYDVEVVDAEPSGRIEERAAKALRASIFRPRLTEGGPHVAEGMSYEHRFQYVPQGRQAEAEAASEAGPRASLLDGITLDEGAESEDAAN